MKRMWLILGGIFIFLLIIIGGYFSYVAQVKNAPKKVVQELFDSKENLEEIITADLINQINNDASADKAFLADNVSDYETTKATGKTTIINQGDTSALVNAEVVTTTKNKKTGFKITTTENYKVYLKKIDEAWKINKVELISSKEN